MHITIHIRIQYIVITQLDHNFNEKKNCNTSIYDCTARVKIHTNLPFNPLTATLRDCFGSVGRPAGLMPSSGDPLSLGGSLPMESPSDGEILRKHKENLLNLNHGMKTQCLCPMPYNLCFEDILKTTWEYSENYNSINYKLYPPFNCTHEPWI